MTIKKDIERDENGNPIVPGGKTFGNVSVPKNSKSSRTNELKDRAAHRIALLLKKGPQADRLARKAEPITDKKHLEALAFHNKLADSPKIVQFAYHRGRLETLREELKALLDSDNKRKVEFNEPAIRRDIEETEETMRELFQEIKMERRIVKE
jgi:hypothetical protein